MWTIISNATWDKMQSTFPKEAWPDGNKAPANFREITEKEFCNSHYYTGYSPAAIQYVQLTHANYGTELKNRVHGNMQINSFGKGFLIELRHWENKVVYWLFDLCQHEYETTKKYNCYWEGKCKKCGHLHAVDSSD